MTHGRVTRIGIALLTLVLGSGLSAPPATAQAPPAPAPAGPAAPFQGVWRSGDSAVRITLRGTEARGAFTEVGQAARTLGFKPGEVSFVATVSGNYLHGEQTIRYAGNCHPNGRKVPMMARMTPDGRVLAIHYYVLTLDASCRDTGEFRIGESLWQRAP
jgi:hypothetical protein